MPQKHISLRQKDSYIKAYPLCLGNISKDFKIADLKEKKNKKNKTELKRSANCFLLIIVLLILMKF